MVPRGKISSPGEYFDEEQGSAVSLKPSTDVRRKQSLDTLYSRFSPEETVEILESVSVVYSDLDGTMLLAGEVQFSEDTLRALERISKLGVRVVFITGKPMSEVLRLVQNTPDNIPLEIVTEKGAYNIIRTADGELHIKDYLIEEWMKGAIKELRRDFNGKDVKQEFEAKYGVAIVPAGDGTHETVLSIDIVNPWLAGDHNLSIDEIKVKDEGLLNGLKEDIKKWMEIRYGKGKFVLIDLGNGNFEIGLPGIDKPLAIRYSEATRTDKGVAMLLGDSGNDESMFELGKSRDNLYPGAVVHVDTPFNLVDDASFCVNGEGNGVEFLNKIIKAKTRSNGQSIIATNTGPFRIKDGKVELCEGMPLAFYRLVQKIEDGAWVYVGNDTFEPEEETLRGKLVSIPVTGDLRQSHYADISNQTLWPVAHKPESGAQVRSFPQAEWLMYEEVCQKVAAGINGKLGTAEHTDGNPTVWVQDYQMLAVADKLKAMRPYEDYNIGIYWHIPFPNAEVLIDELGEEKARQVVKWISDFHMIGFHTHDYEDNYVNACIKLGVTPTRVLVQPISVDVDEINSIVGDLAENGITFDEESLNELFDTNKLSSGVKRDVEYVLCGIERCDDTKGTIERLEAWKALAEERPDLFKGRVVIEVIVPSRMEIKTYEDRYNHAMRLIEETNDILFKVHGTRPLRHLPKIHTRHDVVAAMAASDKVITGLAKKDGYNMSATETTLVQALRGEGSLLISEKIGFHASLDEHGLGNAVNVLFADENGAITSECITRGFERFLDGSANITAASAIGLGEYFDTYSFRTWIRCNLQEITIARLCSQIEPFENVSVHSTVRIIGDDIDCG